jgi:branched-chain amino acid aminotransferase
MDYYNNKTILYADCEFLKASEAKTDLYGQSLHYGYAIFEGIRSYDTANGVKIFKAKEHYERLKRSCELVNIPFSYNVADLTDVTYKLLDKNGFKDAYIRPLVHCSPNMTLSRPDKIHIMICAWEWGAYLGDKLLRVQISSFCRPNPKSIKVEAKVAGHYINSILATTEAKDNGFDEGLLLDGSGYLAEGPGANLFFEKNGKLYTPQTGNILPGITRATVFEIAKEHGIEVEQGLYTPEDLFGADCGFYCGTAAEIVGMESVDNKPFKKEWKSTLGAVVQKAYKERVLEKTVLA